MSQSALTDESMKQCSKCKQTKPRDQFHRGTKASKDGLHVYCKPCSNEYQREYRSKNPAPKGRHRKHLLARYGLTEVDYEAMFEAQRGRCAVCGDSQGLRRLAVDHDHTTGVVRALACDRCNPMIGYALDDPARLRAAADYLERHRDKTLSME